MSNQGFELALADAIRGEVKGDKRGAIAAGDGSPVVYAPGGTVVIGGQPAANDGKHPGSQASLVAGFVVGIVTTIAAITMYVMSAHS